MISTSLPKYAPGQALIHRKAYVVVVVYIHIEYSLINILDNKRKIKNNKTNVDPYELKAYNENLEC